MKKLILFAAAALLSSAGFAQAPFLNWVRVGGGITSDFGVDIKTDNFGNVYSIGLYQDSVDFDFGVNIYRLYALGSADIYMTKYSATGEFKWAKTIGGKYSDYAKSLHISKQNALLVTGSFAGYADMDPGPIDYFVGSEGGTDIFISKFDTAGKFKWSKGLGGKSTDEGVSVFTDKSENVYVVGNFSDTVDFDQTVKTEELRSNGDLDVFIMKMDPNGNFKWIKQIGGPGKDVVYRASMDKDENIIITGSFKDSADFDPSPTDFFMKSSGQEDIFLAKYNPDGNFLWAKQTGGTLTDVAYGIAIDSANAIYTTGKFTSTVDFDHGPGVLSLKSLGDADIFVAKTDESGVFQWARSAGALYADRGISIAVDAQCNVYASGVFQGTVGFDPSSTTFSVASRGLTDMFIWKFDSSGKYQWAQVYGGTSDDICFSICVDADENIYTTGSFKDKVDFDPTTAFYNQESTSFLEDIFILKLGKLPSSINQFSSTQNLSFYPNPTAGLCFLKIPEPNATMKIEVYSMSGVLVYTNSEVQHLNQIDVSNHASGIYFVRLTNNGETAATVKFIKE